jgi:Arc/MetJ-type ribon-helix-helix transcriptional regulator
MSTVEAPKTKVFSFRAPEELEERIDRARASLANLPELDSPEGVQILHEMELALLRRPHRLTRAATQSELLRALVELLLIATEKVERDRVMGDAFAAAAAERSEDERDFTRASTRAAARRWR